MSIHKWAKIVETKKKVIFNGNIGVPILTPKENNELQLVDITTLEGNNIYEAITNDVSFM